MVVYFLEYFILLEEFIAGSLQVLHIRQEQGLSKHKLVLSAPNNFLINGNISNNNSMGTHNNLHSQ